MTKQQTPTLSDTINGVVDAMTAAVQPLRDALIDTGTAITTAFREALTPLLARARPWTTGRELAELAADNRLTAAERYPVRAETTYQSNTIHVQYDDGTGYEEFATYDKEALQDAE